MSNGAHCAVGNGRTSQCLNTLMASVHQEQDSMLLDYFADGIYRS